MADQGKPPTNEPTEMEAAVRDFGVIESSFWTIQVNDLHEHGTHVLLMAVYLKVCPHVSLIGVAHCPVAYMAADTGLPTQLVEESLGILEERQWVCRQGQLIFVPAILVELASQSLKSSDNRVKAVEREMSKLPPGRCRDEVMKVWSRKELPSPLLPPTEGLAPINEAPSKPLRSPLEAHDKVLESPLLKPHEGLRSQEQDQYQEQEPRHGHEQATPRPQPSTSPEETPRTTAISKRATRLPADWQLPTDWENWALQEKPGWTPSHCQQVAASFADYWHAKAGADANKLDWQATWRNWVRNEKRACRNTNSGIDVTDMAAQVRRQLGFGELLELSDA